MAAVLVELGLFYRRRKNILIMKILFGSAGFVGVTAIFWLGFRGDVNSDQWAKWILFDYDLTAMSRSPAGK